MDILPPLLFYIESQYSSWFNLLFIFRELTSRTTYTLWVLLEKIMIIIDNCFKTNRSCTFTNLDWSRHNPSYPSLTCLLYSPISVPLANPPTLQPAYPFLLSDSPSPSLAPCPQWVSVLNSPPTPVDTSDRSTLCVPVLSKRYRDTKDRTHWSTHHYGTYLFLFSSFFNSN